MTHKSTSTSATNSNFLRKVSGVSSLLIMILVLQGCGSGFSVQDQRQKNALLSHTNALVTASGSDGIIPPVGNGSGDGSIPTNAGGTTPPGTTPTNGMPGTGAQTGTDGQTPVPGTGSNTGTTPTTPTMPTTPTIPPTTGTGTTTPPSYDTPVVTVCSTAVAAKTGFSVKSVPQVKLVFTSIGGTAPDSCEINEAFVGQNLKDKRRISIPLLEQYCPSLKGGTYSMRVVPSASAATSKSALFNWPATLVNGWVDVAIANGYRVTITKNMNGHLTVASAETASASPYPSVLINANTTNASGTTAECDIAASPLIVQLNRAGGAAQPIELSAPSQGIYFDILGRRALPVAHTKKQISWLSPASAQHNYFVVLPNSRGEVLGVDEMFGDNTFGPDRKYAANGYEALRKYDGRTETGRIDRTAYDGSITRRDAIYSKLRFWSDANVNGIAESTELFTLDELKVEKIDLNYDGSYSETDQYGNKVKMKSAVTTADGILHLMFDLWFRVP